MSALGYSQELQPTNKGLLISYPLMDSISVKLIHRQYLIEAKRITDSLLISKNQKIDLQTDKINKLKQMAKNSDLKESYYTDILTQKDMILEAERKKSRKRQIYAFGGGLLVGLVATFIFIH